MVARPLVSYLAGLPEIEVRVGDQVPGKAEHLVEGHLRGRALVIDLKNEDMLRSEIAAADLVVSMVPYVFHPVVARYCLALKKNMVTTSYVSEAMRNLDAPARDAGLIFLNETGLDPGIDHMEAMRVIDEVKAEGGRILSFISWCGGLPAPEANTNPFGYKFSWSPLGVLLASKNDARYKWRGEDVFVPAETLFDSPALIPIEGLTEFEGYPNRDSLPYIDVYGIPETKTMLRGTLRYKGWCSTLARMIRLGLLGREDEDWAGETYSDFLKRQVNRAAEKAGRTVPADFRIALDADLLEKLEWLGLAGDEPLPLAKGSAFDILAGRMIKKLTYAEGERDMIILQHQFIAVYPEERRAPEKILSTLIDFGIPHGDSSMARTVGLPAAISARLILEGRIKERGVHIPVKPGIYKPILEELEKQGIVFKEKREKASPE